MSQTMLKEKINPLDLFADNISPEVERMMIKVAERSTRSQLDAIESYESGEDPASKRFLQTSINEVVARERHLAESLSSKFHKRQFSKVARQSRKMNAKLLGRTVSPTQEKMYVLNYGGTFVQILEDADKNITIFKVSSSRLPGLKKSRHSQPENIKKLSK